MASAGLSASYLAPRYPCPRNSRRIYRHICPQHRSFRQCRTVGIRSFIVLRCDGPEGWIFPEVTSMLNRRHIPFFDYPALFAEIEQEVMATVGDVFARGAYIMQKDLLD